MRCRRATGYASVDADGQRMKVLARRSGRPGVARESDDWRTDASAKMLRDGQRGRSGTAAGGRRHVVAEGTVRVGAAATDSSGRTGVVDTTVNAI